MRFRRLFGFLAVCILLCTAVCAAGPDGDDLADTEEDPVETSPPVVVQSFSLDSIADAIYQAIADYKYQGDLVDVRVVPVPFEEAEAGISPAYDLDNGQTSESAGTLKSILVKLIGPYNPVVVEYRYQNYNSSTYSYVREIQPDYVWFCSAGLFALLVFCTFRLGGGLLRRT